MLDLLFGIKNTTTRSVKNVLNRVTRIIHIVLFSLIGLFIRPRIPRGGGPRHFPTDYQEELRGSLYQMQHVRYDAIIVY
jgi:hypothetical protein